MSLFMLNEQELYKQLEQDYLRHCKQDKKNSINNLSQNIYELYRIQLQKIRSIAILDSNQNQSKIYIKLKGVYFEDIFSSIISIQIDRQIEKTKCKIYLVQKNQKYFQFLNHHIFKQACKIITKIDAENPSLIFNFSIFFSILGLNIETRQIIILFPHILPQKYIKTKRNIQQFIKKIIILFQMLNICQDQIMKKISELNKLEEKYINNKSSLNKNSLLKIDRYRQMMNIVSQITQNSVGPQTEHQYLQQKKRISIQKLKNKQVKVDKNLLQLHYFFQRVKLVNNQDFYVRGQQLKFIKMMISMPIITLFTKSKGQNQNAMILNHIKIKDINKLTTQKINQGGFASIQIAQIGYWYVFSSDGEQLNVKSQQVKIHQSPKNMLIKWVVVKRQFQIKSKRYSRNKHQIKIIKKMKNGSSIFLPKYYIPINAVVNSNLDGAVLLDFLQLGTLSDYLYRNQLIVSLQSKLALMFSICQSLRYLRWFNVVHLDLKPQNIMLHYQHMIKLIDFGQSFHSQISQKNYIPGFSVPYSPPQIFGRYPIYTYKCDVFSMGVIFHEIIYGRCPFEIESQNVTYTIQYKSFIQYCHFCPQDLQTAGNYNILRFINSLIQRCLQTNPQDRPQLDWISLMLRQIIQSQF